MREPHPNVQAALAMSRELKNRAANFRDRSERIFARRPSPSGLVIPEVDAMGRLVALYLTPGTCSRLDNQELAADIVAAITDSAADARRQYYRTMNDPSKLPRPLAEILQEWQNNPKGKVPNFGEGEQ